MLTKVDIKNISLHNFTAHDTVDPNLNFCGYKNLLVVARMFVHARTIPLSCQSSCAVPSPLSICRYYAMYQDL